MGKNGYKTFGEKLSLTYKEKEAITLKAYLDMINGMVNHETMWFSFNNHHSEIRFNTKIHLGYFNILLVDFLSKPKDFFQLAFSYIVCYWFIFFNSIKIKHESLCPPSQDLLNHFLASERFPILNSRAPRL